MFRLLFWIALIVAAMWLWRRLKKPPATPINESQIMVRCAHCDVHVPQASALCKNSLWYCSTDHLEQGSQEREH